MIIEATKQGLRAARSNGKAIATLWFINALLAFAAALPGWLALTGAMGNLPLADSLATTFSFGVLTDLLELHPGLARGLGNAAAALFLLGIFVGLAVAGGVLAVLSGDAAQTFAERFGRGAFRYYGRFFRLGIATMLLGGITAGIVSGPLFALRGYVRRESGSEMLTLAVFVAAVAAAGLMILLALLAQDAARVMIVRDGTGGVLRALRRGTALVWRHPIAWLGVWGLNAILLLVALAAYAAFADAAAAAPLIAVVVLQQLFVLVRCTLRVALAGSELALVPVPPPPVEAAPAEIIETQSEPAIAAEMSEVQTESEPADAAEVTEVQEGAPPADSGELPEEDVPREVSVPSSDER